MQFDAIDDGVTRLVPSGCVPFGQGDDMDLDAGLGERFGLPADTRVSQVVRVGQHRDPA